MDIFNQLIERVGDIYLYMYNLNPKLPVIIGGFLSLFLVLLVIKRLAYRQYRDKLIHRVVSQKSLYCMSWAEFEYFVAEYFRRKGFSVTLKGGAQADGGVDLIVKKSRKKHIVQVKHYAKTNKISVTLVREMLGVFIAEKDKMKLSGVIIVTSSSFSKPAIDFASKNGVTLVSGYDLLKNIG